jgi:GxxExxY protein
MLLARELTERIIGLAIEVHRLTGLGMLESVYEGCLCHELQQAEIAFQRQAGIPVTYKGVQFDEGFRMSGLRLGLLFNFHARLLKDGLRRFVV